VKDYRAVSNGDSGDSPKVGNYLYRSGGICRPTPARIMMLKWRVRIVTGITKLGK